MQSIRSALRIDSASRELLLPTARSLIFTLSALYTVWHILATLAWPDVFSPSIWLVTLSMLGLVALVLRLLERRYLLAQAIWLAGLAGVILLAYALYQRPEIVILLGFLPLIAIISVGSLGALLVELGVLALLLLMPLSGVFPPLPPTYSTAVVLSSIFAGVFGWGLTNSLLSAVDAASYHHQQARGLLEDSREHRAEIARMLKDQHQANYQLERLNQMLNQARQRADDVRADHDRFIMSVSHELRSPLNFILGFSDLMANSPATYAPLEQWPAGLYEDASEIYRSSRHLLGLINDILDLGQIEAQQMSLLREFADLPELVREAVEMVQGAYQRKGLYLTCEIEAGLPELLLDRTRIRQVLLNLLNNSLRFTDQGGVTITLRRGEQDLELCVSDSGAGIAQEDIPRVFNLFSQVGDEDWRRREGSGLGLAISQRFIQLHGGRMWLESELGQGSRVYFTLPLQPGSPALELASGADLGAARLRSLQRLVSQEQVLLLLSADPQAAQRLRPFVEDFTLIHVSDTAQLGQAVAQYFPRAVLIDDDLDNCEPPTLLSELAQALPLDLPLISLSLPQAGVRATAQISGVDAYLVKPIPRPDLLEAIARLEQPLKRLLVVDDDPAMVRFVTQAVKTAAEGHPARLAELLSAASGSQALEQLHAAPIDLVLLDLDLPDLNGWQVLASMHQDPRLAEIPVIIISATDPPPLIAESGSGRLSLRLGRPFSHPEYSALLKELLGNLQPAYVNTLGSG